MRKAFLARLPPERWCRKPRGAPGRHDERHWTASAAFAAEAGMTFRRPLPIELAGGCNVRDLGGHGAVGSRDVARGLLYRSGVLSYLTPSDHNCLARLRLETVVDLRRPDEIAAEPTWWPSPVNTITFPEDPQRDRAPRGVPWKQATEAGEARAILLDTYATMHEWLAPALRAIFGAILERRLPLLFHCAAGKDRTGFCAGIVLALLGVSEETILAEYAFTNEVVDLYAFAGTHRAAAMGVTDAAHPLDQMPMPVRAALLTADPAYLKAALDAVADRYGSVEGYALGPLGLSEADIAAIRALLLDD
jgi:protein-tyrosine phosphatase